jgi:hypothetical protein
VVGHVVKNLCYCFRENDVPPKNFRPRHLRVSTVEMKNSQRTMQLRMSAASYRQCLRVTQAVESRPSALSLIRQKYTTVLCL